MDLFWFFWKFDRKIASENASEFFENERLRWIPSRRELENSFYPRDMPEVGPGRPDRLEIDNSPPANWIRREFAERRFEFASANSEMRSGIIVGLSLRSWRAEFLWTNVVPMAISFGFWNKVPTRDQHPKNLKIEQVDVFLGELSYFFENISNPVPSTPLQTSITM